MISPTQLRAWQATRLGKAVALLCILLVLTAGAAHLLHSHAEANASEAGCSLCVVAHLAAAPAALVAGPVLSEGVRRTPPPDTPVAGTTCFLSAFHIRPPPALIPHA